MYNLRHAQARNVIERIFGVLKKRFNILVIPPHFNLDIQVRVPPGLAAVHNMIVWLDPYGLKELLEELEQNGGPLDPYRGTPLAEEEGSLATGPIRQAEEVRASALRDQIAAKMWEDYQCIVQARQVVD